MLDKYDNYGDSLCECALTSQFTDVIQALPKSFVSKKLSVGLLRTGNLFIYGRKLSNIFWNQVKGRYYRHIRLHCRCTYCTAFC